MVVMPKQNVPALRLEGFSGEWEETTLGELGSTYGGLSGKKKEDFGHGDAMYVTYKDIFSRALITDTSQCERVEVDASQNEVRYGDIFFTTSSEIPEEVGLSAVWLIDKPNVYLNSFCFGFRPTGGFDLHFLGHVLRSPAVRSQFLLLAQGISRFNISKTKAANISLYAPPTLEEQQAIGAVFTNLDAAINQHTLKHKALQQSKTALMQRMFPQEDLTAPELRLEGFSGEWEKTTLGELGAFRSGVGFPEREQGGTIGLPFYKVSDLSAPGNELQLQSANHYVTEGQIVRNHWTPVTAVPAILFAKVGAAVFLGRKRLVNNAFLLDNNLMAFSLNTESWDVQFADTYLKTVDLTQFTQSGALPSLNARHLAEAEAIIPPTLEEQQAIGAVFTNLDQLIAAEAQYIASLKQAKTALLQRMFI